MRKLPIAWLALLGAGALVAASGVAAGSPDGSPIAERAERGGTLARAELSQRRTRNPDRLRYYRVTLEHEGSVRFRSLTQLAPGLLQNNLDDRTSSYIAASNGPIAVTAGCLTPFKGLFLPSTRWAETCRAANRRATAAMLRPDGTPMARVARRGLPRSLRRALPRLDRGPRTLRKRVVNAVRKQGDETYTFGPSLLAGTLAESEQTERTFPITTRVPGVPNLVLCSPQEQMQERLQTSPQTGLIVRLQSGDGRVGQSSEAGLRVRSRAVVGAPPAGLRETFNQVECPSGDPSRPRVAQRGGVIEGTDLWQPTDLLTSRDRQRGDRRARALEFTKRPGTFGKKFTVKVGSIENGRAVAGRGPTLARDEHDYVLTFTPCPKKGTVRRGC